MGWASGSRLAGEIWDLVKDEIPESDRRSIALGIIKAFEDMDCDTIDECEELCRAARPVRFASGHLDLTEGEFEEHYVPLLDAAMNERCHIVVGDAPGADTMVQRHLEKNGYERVSIFHMFFEPRNHLDKWWGTLGGFRTDEERDAAMTAASDIDIAWVRPGRENSGTARNIKRRTKAP